MKKPLRKSKPKKRRVIPVKVMQTLMFGVCLMSSSVIAKYVTIAELVYVQAIIAAATILLAALATGQVFKVPALADQRTLGVEQHK